MQKYFDGGLLLTYFFSCVIVKLVHLEVFTTRYKEVTTLMKRCRVDGCFCSKLLYLLKAENKNQYNTIQFLKTIFGESSRPTPIDADAVVHPLSLEGTTGGDNSVPQPYFLTKLTFLYSLIAPLLLMYRSLKTNIS